MFNHILFDEIEAEDMATEMPVFKLTAEMNGIDVIETAGQVQRRATCIYSLQSQLAAGEGLESPDVL